MSYNKVDIWWMYKCYCPPFGIKYSMMEIFTSHDKKVILYSETLPWDAIITFCRPSGVQVNIQASQNPNTTWYKVWASTTKYLKGEDIYSLLGKKYLHLYILKNMFLLWSICIQFFLEYNLYKPETWSQLPQRYLCVDSHHSILHNLSEHVLVLQAQRWAPGWLGL